MNGADSTGRLQRTGRWSVAESFLVNCKLGLPFLTIRLARMRLGAPTLSVTVAAKFAFMLGVGFDDSRHGVLPASSSSREP
jgi:hypothetical protein